MGTAVGTFSGRSNHRIRLETQVAGQNVAGNFSAINWQLYAEKTSASTSYYLTANGSGSVNIGGNVVGIAGWSYDFRTQTTILLGSGTVNIGHNADGTMAYTFSGSASTPGTLGSASASGSEAVAQIPRATTGSITPQPVFAGSNLTFNLPRASTSFLHSIQVFYGSYAATIADNVATSFVWTVPLSLSQQTPNLNGGNGFIRVITYNGGTQIGIVDTALAIQVPASVVPTFTDLIFSEATVGLAANVGAYVQGVSTLNLSVTGAAGAQGSTIVGARVDVAGQVVPALPGVTAAPLATSGATILTATVTDSRGRTAVKTYSINVLPYAPPSLTAISVVRATITGAPADEGTYLRVNINASVQSLVSVTERNALTYRISSRLRGTTGWTVKQTTSPGGITLNSFAVVDSYAITSAWEVLVDVIDDFSTSSAQFTVATSAIFMHWDGQAGVGIGKYRQFGQLDVLGTAFVEDGKRVATVDVSRKGTVSASWMFGPVAVNITDGLDTTTTASATIAGNVNPIAIKPGAEVLLSRTGAAWVITSVTAAPRVIRRIKLVLQNGWTDYADGSNFYGSSHIWVDSNGIVGLEGLLFRATVPVDGSLIANLPAGMGSPAAGALIFPAANNGGMGQLRIVGDTITYSGQGAVGYFSLESARWRHSSIARTPLPLNGAWVNYGSGFAPPAFTIDSNGVVLVEGLVMGGAITAAAAVATFPATIQGPTNNIHIPTVVSSAFGYFRIGGAAGANPGRVLNWGGGPNNTWLSLCCSFVDASSSLPWVMLGGSFLNGWVPFGGGHQQPGFTRTPGGLGFVRGLWKAGTVGTTMARAPHEVLPDLAEAKIFCAVSADTLARFDVVNSVASPNQVSLNFGSTAWASIEGMWRIGSTYTGPDQGIFSA